MGTVTTITVGEIFRRYATAFLEENPVSYDQLRVINDLKTCRTSDLGGHWMACKSCGNLKVHYNSCGNRHCPGCQGANKEKWILERSQDLLPVKYFHMVITLPEQLRGIVMQNQKICYHLLYKCAWETLQEFGRDPREKLQAKMGMIAILHTWTQKLIYHPHLHYIIPAGGVRNLEWIKTRSNGGFLFYVKNIASKFRGKFMDHLHQEYLQGKLSLKGKLAALNQKDNFYKLKDHLFNIEWVAYTKESFGGPQQVMEYLGRYTHRIAISNYRIIKLKNDQVTFNYLDREDNYQKKQLELPVFKFIRRFLNHVVPYRFTRIRHYGFLSSRNKTIYINFLRKYFKLPKLERRKYTIKEALLIMLGIDMDCCPVCREGILVSIKEIPAIRGSPYTY